MLSARKTVPRVPGQNLLLQVVLSGLPLSQGCGFSSAEQPSIVELSERSGEPLDAVPCVPRLVLRGAEPGGMDALWLLEGEVTGATEEKLLRGEVPESAQERRVPLAVWTVKDEVHLAPTVVLQPATTYTLFVIGRGSPGVVRTSSDTCEIWHRWGGADSGSTGSAVYCSAPPPWLLTEHVVSDSPGRESPELVDVRLDPAGRVAEVSRGLLAPEDGCVELTFDAHGAAEVGGEFLLPPQSFDGRSFEPAPLWLPPPSSEGLGGGSGEEVSLRQESSSAPDEATDAVRVVSSGEILEVELGLGIHVLEVGSRSGQEERLRLVRLVEQRAVERLGPLGAGVHVLEHLSIGPDGVRERGASEFVVTPGTAEPIITEVLANPNGPEPDSEWVELYNPSVEPRSLAGYRLHDAGGTTELPAVLLPPGGYGVVVTAKYAANSGVDVVPDARAVPIVVESIGKQGLTNSGEEIWLETAEGTVASRVPAIECKEGISVVRRHPLAPDVATSFGAHGSEGASPGASGGPEEPGQ